MEYWTLICNILSTISASGVLVCTLIGFKYIHKQINIAKNKDILFSFQKDIYLFMEQFYSNHYSFYLKLIKIINEHKYLDEIDDKDINDYMDLNKKINIYINNYPFVNLNGLKYPLINYKWWLSGEIYKKYNDIFDDISYKRMCDFQYEYSNCFNKCIKRNVDPNSSSEQKIKEAILKDIQSVSAVFTEDLNKINKKFNELLSDLAKNKGVL